MVLWNQFLEGGVPKHTEENQKILKQREVYQIYVYINAYIPLNQQYKITNKDLSP